MAVATYIGVVREGQIRLAESITLPEGSQVYVVVPAVMDEHIARHKANRWLIENVGNMVMADADTAEEMIRRGEHFEHSPPSSEG